MQSHVLTKGDKTLKAKKKIVPILSVLLVIAIAVIGYGVYILKMKTEEYDSLKAESDANQQIVYVAKERVDEEGNTFGIKKGEKITDQGTDANVYQQNLYTGLDPYSYITVEDMGKTAIVDIAAEEPVMLNMVTAKEIQADTRDYEVVAANLMSDQQENDYVDIRIVFPNGEDYLVVPKKQIEKLNFENSVFNIQCNEEEIVRFSSAIVDAYMTTGARLYTTRYVESNLQEEAIPNYPVRAETMDLIKSDPNILTTAQNTLNLSARMSLEARLGKLTEDQLSAVSDGFGLTDTAKSSVLTANVIADQQTGDTQVVDDAAVDETGTAETPTEAESAPDTTTNGAAIIDNAVEGTE